MKRPDHKSDCPVNYTVEIFGDTWSMIIYRDMATFGKRTFGEFLASEERIGPSVLAERLVHLEKKGIISKAQDSKDKRKVIYTLTADGIKAVPILYEIAVWGSTTYANPISHPAWFESMELEKAKVTNAWRIALEAGDSFFSGQQSAISQLGLSL